MFMVVNYVREITVKKSCKYANMDHLSTWFSCSVFVVAGRCLFVQLWYRHAQIFLSALCFCLVVLCFSLQSVKHFA